MPPHFSALICLVSRCGCCFERSDPDEENFSGGWFVQRVHSARLKLRASCGFLSFLMAGPQDYVLGAFAAVARVWKVIRACPVLLACAAGVQNGSIAGTEGITFHSGDGAQDTDGALRLTGILPGSLPRDICRVGGEGEAKRKNI